MNFIARRTLSRRAVLRGAGAAIALPILDAMVPAFASTPGAQRTRLVCIEEVHGLAGCNKLGAERFLYAPATVGRDYRLVQDNPLRSLERWRAQMTIISNTDVRMAEPVKPSEVGGDHFRSSAVFLTQSRPKQTQGSDVHVGASLDQLHARRFGAGTMLPSLQLGIEPTDRGGGCGYGYSCAYTDSISWASETEPLPAIRNPRVVFDMLFGAGGTDTERALRRRMHASILDSVLASAGDMKRRLGPTDRRHLDRYLSSVREVERRIQLTEPTKPGDAERRLPDAPAGVPDSFSEHMQVMFDLQVLAFEADITRVISFKTGRDASSRIFPESGSNRPFHPASHHGGSLEGVMEFNKICQYRVAQLAYFLERMAQSHDGDRNLLEQSLIVWGSPMADGNLHNHRRCPLMVFGGGNGIHRGGAHVRAPDGTPMANALLTLMNRLGHNLGQFGDSTGELAI